MDLPQFVFGTACLVVLLSYLAMMVMVFRKAFLETCEIKLDSKPVSRKKLKRKHKTSPTSQVDPTQIKNDKQMLSEILPELVWEQVLLHLRTHFQALDSCSKASDLLDCLIWKIGHLSIVSSKEIVEGRVCKRIDCFPTSLGVRLFPEPVLPKAQITTMNICVHTNFHPILYYLEWLIESQRDSLEILHISCLGLKTEPVTIELPEMGKLRELKLVRNLKCDWENRCYIKSLEFAEPVLLPALESLTLSAFSWGEHWEDFLGESWGNADGPIRPTVKHLRILPSRPKCVEMATLWVSGKHVLPNLVSLEIPAVLLDVIRKLFPAPEQLKRLTLTLPTRGLHKHLFDVSITGYGEQVCTAILANPERNPVEIRKEIEEENARHVHDIKYSLERRRIKFDNRFRRQGKRFYNLTVFQGLQELKINSDTGNWGPTLVSAPDLFKMKSLKTLRFSGHKPKYIPDDVLNKMKEKFAIFLG